MRVLLDGKPVRTPARRALTAPAPGLAEALAAEWNAQEEVIDPAAMPLTRLANSIIDGVAQTPLPVAEEIAQYLRSDLLFYRAEGPQGLVERQERQWDPVLDLGTRSSRGAVPVGNRRDVHRAAGASGGGGDGRDSL